ncbi:hydantoinase B/oxoprolinase family protein [Acuticoccus sp. I52.16.1]|uniref:hydantoinase B/oxoprolinase family protein n=1 Tax=Acuticoccus sp. I52.16.1 TaxID=2928472 RepID=UPI001FD43299|nr:hydantoinase B/oxoprolinase family protein [Acuticoccus sp. I52.16.1]UOM35472.1 hydantoinase B/oxoprolinase family protein [Acuticoccus sp. I52.16.1]
MDKPTKAPIDGVRLAVFNNRFEGIARKMANTLLRTGRSGVLNIARDFSCCIVTRDDQLLATAESLPIHVLSGPDLMAKSMKEFHPGFQRGDAFLHNSPYHGCSHPADHTIVLPVIDDAGVHHFTLIAKAHQADCGNSQPTTYMGSARDVYEEGALIFPCVKVQENHANIEDIVRMCRMRIRVPEQWWGDYLAMIGAARIGERELLALGEEVGWESLHDFTAQWFDYSESRMVNAIRKIPSGAGSWTSTHDPVPGAPADGIPIHVAVTVDNENARIAVDLTDNIDALPCGLNLSEACARTSAMVGVFNAIDSTVPKNAGAFRRLDIHLREGAVCGIPRHPTSCSVATTNLADRVANAVQATMAELHDGIGLAECGPILPASVGVVSGIDPASGERYVNQIFLAMTGGAGSPNADAWVTLGHVGNSGLCYQDSVELDELRHPLFVEERRFLADTEGAGRHKGAPSMRVEFGPARGEMQVAFVSDGTINAAKGVRGGSTGGAARQAVKRGDGALQEIDLCTVVTLREGERIVSHCCGGGGYGEPSERAVAAVAADLAERWVTAARAREVYRVVVGADGAVDVAATDALRATAGA